MGIDCPEAVVGMLQALILSLTAIWPTNTRFEFRVPVVTHLKLFRQKAEFSQ